jgi:putative nucleotidyltransferase with HDIG domain
MQILIVDDEKSIRTTLKLFLEREGFVVDLAETALQAMELLELGDYDILITDIVMPKMTGVEFLKEIHQSVHDVPVIMMTGEPTVETAVISLQIGAFDYLYKPIQKESLIKTVKQAAIVRELALQKKVLELEKIEYQKNLESLIAQRTEDLDKSMQSSIKIMTSLVDLRDPYTSGHQIRTGNLSAEIGRKLGLSEFEAIGLKVAGYLHDIGKLSLPAEILVKPSKLSHFEFEMIKTHSESGYYILKELLLPWPVADIIYQHHERLDGTGYPRGLKDKEILKEARILAVADIAEAMASHRPYRPSLGLEAALSEIDMRKGSSLDSDVVIACMELLTRDGYIIDSEYHESSLFF